VFGLALAWRMRRWFYRGSEDQFAEPHLGYRESLGIVAMKHVACVGECMMELVENADGTLTRSFGGDTLNTALYLARLGVPTEYITALGVDPFSDEMVRAWACEGIGTLGVVRLQGHLPGLYLIRTDKAGERAFFYWRDNAPVRQLFNIPETPAVQAALLAADLIYLSGISLSLFG
jgi:2-dehydro-3-deoxygluconokinase